MQNEHASENAVVFDPNTTRCPLCKSDGIFLKYHIDRYAISFYVYECVACGFMFMNPPLSDNSAAALYNEDYFKGRADYSYCDEREAIPYFRHVWKKRIEIIRRFVPSGRFLDVGCSFGGFLMTASPYFDTFGIEASAYASEHAALISNAHIHTGTLDSHAFPGGHFNVVTMIELIEHLRDPLWAIEECHRLLAPGGLLLIQTANMAGLQARAGGMDYAYFMPGHLSYFTRKNLCEALRRTGFGTIRVFQPVEFGLIPKLKKSRYSFTYPWQYIRWIRISLYHFASLIHIGNFAMTSSMVIYALKPDKSEKTLDRM